ncbi:uncharacterized protein FIBRA_04174 [Fibroporia radiculosa]|uniref:Late embryogenesis abundant protein LEA-2 subgroup domain-containing protein n=1 Tax=Fibroporia radiculosa TaxID=599839 RepID=J4HWE0_9APHY|nr:uncharacterized protein FIBRA_04174 [Fibroporia radiculosa]CCM02097.1 predicted protein [Fibroporia radiculosa]
MAYQDPYYGNQQPLDEPFNPYANDQPHRSYDQGGFNYDSGGYSGGYNDDPNAGTKEERERSVFEADDAASRPLGPRSVCDDLVGLLLSLDMLPARTSRNLRKWRYDNQGGLWTKGGGLRACGRFFCCTLMIAVFLFISIVLSLALWIRPPSVLIRDPQLVQNSSAVTISNDTLEILMDLNATVNNPNYFSVDLADIQVDLFYPINNTALGDAQAKNIDFRSNTQTNFTLNIALQYNFTSAPTTDILVDLAKRCGILPGVASSDITLNYKVLLDIKILAIPIKPTVSSSVSFACPLSSADIGEMLQQAGINADDLGDL